MNIMLLKIKIKFLFSHFKLFGLIYSLPFLKSDSGSSFKDFLVSKKTSIVIEGYPRSGNTFLSKVIEYCNDEINIASHLHYPYQVIFGANLNKPIIILFRSPEAAVSSLMIRNKKMDIKTALLYYKFYYSEILKYKDDIVLVSFDNMLKNLPKLIDCVNKKYFTNFKHHENDLEKIKRITSSLEYEE